MSDPNLMANKVPLGRAYEIIDDGKTFGNYLIVRCLAYDMLGTLYLVQNQQTNQRETLFVFPSLVLEDAGFHERFVSQTKKLCELKHPTLLNFLQPLVVENSYCLVGEPFEGLNIPDHLMMLTGSQLSVSENRAAANLPPEQVTPILEQVLTALDFAHDAKVMHLNLSPAKILRSTYGEVKVYGFHFLAILGQELFEMLVSAGIPPLKLDPKRPHLGTTDILSPEARLRKPLEYRSDIYAIGVNTHWLLTGCKPTSPYQPPSKILPGIEPGWDAFTLHCLQRNPDERYATAKAALADLRNLAQLTPVAQNQPLELLLAPESAAPAPERKKSVTKSPLVKITKAAKAPRKPRKPLTRVQRLLLIGVPALLAVAIGAYLYMMLMADDDDAPTGNLLAWRAPEGQTPKLTMTITPRNSFVTITPGKNVFPVSDGALRLMIMKGDYTITVESPRYQRHVQKYSVTPAADQLSINLTPTWAVVDFTTVPGATLQAQPEHGEALDLGIADAGGALHVTKGLGDGNYTFTATKEDYQPAELANQKIELTKTYHFDLKPTARAATITLTTDPPGVTVRIGDHVLGQTPLTTTDIPIDTDVNLTLEKAGYQAVARTLRVRPNVTETVPLGDLSARIGDLALGFTLGDHAPTAEELRDTKILIDGRPNPGTTTRVPNMLEGAHQIAFQHPDYFPQEQSFAITDGKTTNVAVNLLPRPARLVIQATPALPISVFLDDQPLAPGADGFYPLPPEKAAQVRVEAKNYASITREFKPGPNHTETWAVTLQILAPPKTGENYQIPYLGVELNWIAPGKFIMGSPGQEPERKSSEGPATNVTIPLGFWAGRYEVTQEQYQAVMNENPSEFGRDSTTPGRYPVEKISWMKAREFAQKVNTLEQAAGRVPAGYEYRLPTEAEWEYFARAGTTTPFSFGSRADQSNGNFKAAYPTGSASEITSANAMVGTKPVGSYPPNAWGLYDTAGNVSEWVLDAYKSLLPGGDLTTPGNPVGNDNARREYRGGGWKDYARDARSAWRDLGVLPTTVSNSVGVRLVLAPKIPAGN